MSNAAVRQHEFEPVPGLPEDLPDGESILWQGRPDSALLARRALRSRWIGGYFLLLIAAALWASVDEGRSLGATAFSTGVLAILGAVVLGLVELYAWAIRATSLYTVTNKRVVMRVGAATSVTLNLPYSRIASADMKVHADGSGLIVFQPKDQERVAWIYLWPHVKPWSMNDPRPAMRCLPDVQSVAAIIAGALAAQQGSQPAIRRSTAPSAAAPTFAQPIAAE